ncbi:MAG TPA: hypothetical protein VFX59_19250 [Polyangiales bacterium]|nr:hypothetical protein [Polyangiales bacterium]
MVWRHTLLLVSLSICASARAEVVDVLEAPLGGRPIPLGEGRVSCGGDTGGWDIEAHGQRAKPPSDDASVGAVIELKVAPSQAACTESETYVHLITIDRLPAFDLASVLFSPDEGRLDVEGARLKGAVVAWKSGTNSGFDTCRDPFTERAVEKCTWGVAKGASADLSVTTFQWYPRGARVEANAIFFDAQGKRLPPETFSLVPARVLLTRLVPADASVDLATGQGEVPLVHPEAVGSAECAPLSCEMSDNKLLVRGASSLVNTVDVKLRLIPHVYMMRKDALDTQPTVRMSVNHCPMALVSGPPIRNNDDAKVVLKLDGSCARDPSTLRFAMRDQPLKVLQIQPDQGSTYVLVQIGRVGGDTISISAFRGDVESIAIASAFAQLRSAPQVRASLSLAHDANLGFIPNNRWTTVNVSPAGEHQYFALLPIEGVYRSREQHDKPALIKAEPHAAGLTVLHFGLRSDRLPAGLDSVDLAIVEDPLQRATAEANIPAPIEGTDDIAPLVEFMCGGGDEKLQRIEIGVTAYLDYALRDTCRVVFHRERLSPESGTQKLQFEVDVLKPDGTARGDAHVGEVVTLRAGNEPRYAWIKGITDPFDRVRVRVAHITDENHYIGGDELRTGQPAAQWSAVLGAGRVRLYGTSTIPTGLYRFGDKDSSGVLSLNFGVISRFAYLDKEGREFPLALETGVLVFGVANSYSTTNQNLRQVGVVFGLGFAVPIANRGQVSQASINVHAWGEVNVMRETKSRDIDRLGFIFGPSISIGNVGTGF